MSYVLRFNPDGSSGNNYVSFVTGITGNLGTQTYSYRVKGILNALPTVTGTPGAFGFIGTATNAQSNGICVYSTGAVNVISGGSLRYGTSAGFLSVGVPFDFTVSHISTGAWTITDNLTSTVVASGTFTASTSWSSSLNNIGRLNSTTTHYLKADIELIEVTGHTNARTWDANLSGGTGDILPTTVGTNQGTLVNFPMDNREWVFYGSGDQELLLGTLSSTTVLYEPSVTKDKLVELPVIPGGSSLFEPTVIKDKLIEPSSITSGSSVFGPTVTKGSPSLNIGLNTIDSTVFFYDSTIKKDLRIQLLPMASTSIVYGLLLRKDLWVILGTLGSTSTVYTQEVIGGAIPLPSIELVPDEGYGLHIRTAKEMNDMILALAKRIQILEQQVL